MREAIKKLTNHVDESLLDSNPKKYIIAGLVIIVAFFGGFGAWASLFKLSGAIISNGKISIEGERQTVEHLEGGIIKEIRIKDGDHVTKGDIMVVLESASISASVEVLRRQYYTAMAQVTRLAAEKEGNKMLTWPEALMAQASTPEVAEIIASEEKMFISNLHALESQVGILRTQTVQIDNQISGLVQQRNADTAIIATLMEEYTAQKQLYEKRYVERSQLLATERRLEEHKGRLGRTRGSIAKFEEQKNELQLRIQSMVDGFKRRAVAEFNAAQARLFDLEEQLKPREDAARRLEVTAPVSGTIVDLRINSPGSVLKSDEKIADIVPDNVDLVVDAKIGIGDISKVFTGQKGRAQLNAFNQRTTEPINGSVTYVSADSQRLRDAFGQEQSYYTIKFKMNGEEISAQQLTLAPGMPVTLYLATAERTLMDYLLEPLVVNFRQAFRE